MSSFPRIILAAAAILAIAGSPALAGKCEIVKNGKCYGSTTYVYKDGRAKSYTNPSAYKKPVEQCRARCLASVAKVTNTNAQTAVFNRCARSC